jgi:alpha-glucoside transport system permease protein
MGQLVSALITVVLGLGAFVGGLLVLYAVTNALPKRFRDGGQIAVFLGPAIVLIVVGLLVPAVRTILLSVLSDKEGRPFGGLTNYKYIFTDRNMRLAVVNSALWVIFGGTTSTFLGLTIARYLDGAKGERFAKSLVFIPQALSLAGAGIIWKFVYDGPPFAYGLLNAITKVVPGMPDKWGGDGQRIWLLESGGRMNTFLLIVILVWVQTGFATVVLSAAIKGVPETLAEAATVDGATTRQVFYKVTLPYIRPAILTVLTTGTIGALKAFDIIQATTGGNFKTSTVANEQYIKFFLEDRDGLASALAVLLFVIVIPIVVLNQRGQKRAAEIMGG